MTFSEPIVHDEAALFRAAFDELAVGAAVIDPDGRFRYANRALAAMSGLPQEALAGRSVSDVLPGAADERMDAIASVLAGGGSVVDRTVRGVTAGRPDGGIWLETYRRLDAPDGAVAGLLLTVQDVTDVRQTSSALDQERADAAVLAALADDVLDESDEDGVASIVLSVAIGSLRARSGVVYLAGRQPDRLELAASIGLEESVAAEFRDVVLGSGYPIAECVRTGEAVLVRDQGDAARYPEDAALHRLRGDGATLLMPLRAPGRVLGAFILTLEPGALTAGVVARARTFANVAAASIGRARATRAHRQARRLVEAVIAHMPIGVAVTDTAGALTLSNPALDAIWAGRRSARALDEYGEWAGFHPDGRRYEAHEWPLARTLEAGEVVVGEEIAIERFDGTRGAIAISSAPVREPDGPLVAAVAVVTDITERRERERARDAFLGILAHELRTPLTTILGSARLLGRPALAPAYRDGLVGDIEAEAERMARVIENLLVISRVERGIPIHGDDPVLIQRILPQVVAAERDAWPAVRFDLVVDNALPPVRGEDGLLRQVLGNLLSNAGKYGGGDVVVGAERDGDAIRITVTDAGPGIDPADAAHVFELFYRSSRTRGVASGAGIGLFVVRQLVAAMGGDVHVEPAETGACFVVRLPPYESADVVARAQ